MRSIGGFRAFGEGENPWVYAKDVQNGQLYRSRFGFLVYVKDGHIYKEMPDGKFFEMHPDPYSIFYVEECHDTI